MFHTNKRGRNGVALDDRISERDGGGGVITDAELYLAAGKIVRQQLRRGSPMMAIARRLGVSIVEALSALRYAQSSPALILQALVEDWSWQRIMTSVEKRRNIDNSADSKH